MKYQLLSPRIQGNMIVVSKYHKYICNKSYVSLKHPNILFTIKLFHETLQYSFPRNLSSTSRNISSHTTSKSLNQRDILNVDNPMDEFSELENKDGYFDNDADLDELNHQGENDDPDPAYRVGKLILKFSRIQYRHITNLPDWFKLKQAEIVQYRSPSQIRRCLKNWMIDTNNFEFNKKYLSKPLLWRNDDMNSSEAKNLKIYGADEAVAYAHYHMPGRFSIACRIFQELKQYLPNFKPERVIDYGCGTGTGGAAVKEVYGDDMKKYSGVDMSRAMLDSAKIMLETSDEDQQNQLDCIFWDKIGDVVKRVDQTQERFNLGIIAYALSELTTDTAKRAAVQVMFELLEVGGCLVLMEAGNPHGSHTVRTARQFVLDNFQNRISPSISHKKSNNNDNINLILPFQNIENNDVSVKVIAPCTHDKRCPLGSGVFCSFSQKVLSGMIRKGSEEKYSYVILQKVMKNKKVMANKHDDLNILHQWTSDALVPKQHFSNNLPFPASSTAIPTPREVLLRFLSCNVYEEVTQLLDKLVDEVDWDEYNPPLYRHEWSRVIRSPIKSKGHVILDACTPSGRIQRSTFTKANVMNIPSLYVSIRKTTWGGLFPSDVTSSSSPTISNTASSESMVSPYSPLTYATKKRIEGDQHPFSRPVDNDKMESKSSISADHKKKNITSSSPGAKAATNKSKQAYPVDDWEDDDDDDEEEGDMSLSTSKPGRQRRTVLSNIQSMKKKRQDATTLTTTAASPDSDDDIDEDVDDSKHSSGLAKTLAKAKLKRRGSTSS